MHTYKVRERRVGHLAGDDDDAGHPENTERLTQRGAQRRRRRAAPPARGRPPAGALAHPIKATGKRPAV